MRQKSWNQLKKTMAASTLAGAITFTGCAVMPSVTAFADTTEQTGQVSYDNEVMPIHTDVQTEAKPLMKGTSCTVSDGKNLYYAFEMMGVRMGIMKYNTKTGKKSEVYSYKIGKNKKGSNGFSQLSVDKKYLYATWDRYYGTDATKEYIYRIAKDGKSAKKLAIGRDPQLVDGRIYYLALKSKSEDGMNYSEDTGTVMSMKTDGTDKKKVAQIVNSGDAYRYSLFQSAGKIYYFDPLDYDLETAMHVIVETARGVEMGTVLIPPKEVDDDKVVQPLKPVIRIATEDDEKVIEKNKEKEAEAYVICKEKIAKHGLDMKLVAAEYTFDNNKLLFYFTADGRIDFRELVKDLASVFRTRIELRQIGVRDETKMLGGIGICGRELCCRSYLTDFVPVSIKMAKEQNLSLNPTKISGVCGRLMCCLKNEQETYEYLNSRLPLVGDSVITPTGMHGEVSGVNVLRQLVKVVVDNGEEKELQEYAVDDLKFTSRRRRDVRVTDEEMKELEGLEDNGSTEEENERPQRENRRENNRGKYRREQNDASPETDVGSESRENREKNDSGEKREYRDRSNYRGKKREYRDRNDNGEKREYRERSNYRGRNYNRDRGENADRENSGGGGEKREYRGERNFRRHRNYDRKNYQGGNNERGEQKRGDNPQS